MNTRRTFLKALPMVPAALAGAVAVAKNPVWNLDWTDVKPAQLNLEEMFDLVYKIKQRRMIQDQMEGYYLDRFYR